MFSNKNDFFRKIFLTYCGIINKVFCLKGEKYGKDYYKRFNN